MSSHTVVIAPIISALKKAEDILGKDRVWTAINDEQSTFLNDYFSLRAELKSFTDEELRNWISRVAAELNKILKDEGFSIKLEDFEEDGFGVVSILKVKIDWAKEGERVELQANDKVYPAVNMQPIIPEEDGSGGHKLTEMYTRYELADYEPSIVAVNTKSGDKVFMVVADKELSSFSLINRIDEIRKNLEKSPFKCNFFRFPMIDLDQEENIDWLLKMYTLDDSGNKTEVSQALQQTKFKMNEFGALIESAVALGFLAGMCITAKPQYVIIDKPFYLWVERPGTSIPVMYAYIDYADWKDPGSIDK